MKKWIKILLWTFGSFLTVIFVGIVVVYFWISTKWTDYYTKDEMQNMTKEIQLTEPFSDNFYNAYDKIFPNQRDRRLAKMSFQVVWYILTKNEKKLMTM